jgi:hypothetical protein
MEQRASKRRDLEAHASAVHSSDREVHSRPTSRIGRRMRCLRETPLTVAEIPDPTGHGGKRMLP